MKRRFWTHTIGAVAALVLFLLALLPQPTSGTHVEPVYVGYDAACSDLAPAGTEWNELEVTSVVDGTYSLGPLTVTLDVHESEDRVTVDWSSNLAVQGVFVQGGPGGNFYDYGSGVNVDTGLSAPMNPGGNYHKPDHLLFCTTTTLNTATPTLTPTFTPTVTPTTTMTTTPLPTPTAPMTATVTATPTATAVPGTPTAIPSPSPTPQVRDQLFFPAICNICFDAVGEPNNSCVASFPVQPNTPQAFYAEDQNDWYRFELEFAADIEVRVTNFVPILGQVAAYMGDNCGSAQFLGNYGEPGSEKTLSLGPRPAGTYFLYVSNDGEMNSTDLYELMVETR